MVAYKKVGKVIYVEGGGDEKHGRSEFRRGLSSLAKKLLGEKAKPCFIPSGSVTNAIDDFVVSLKDSEDSLLLVDSGEPIADPSTGASPWTCGALKAKRPKNVRDDRCHLMVSSIEAWLLADRRAVQSYFGKEFSDSRLPANPPQRSEKQLKDDLRHATRGCANKKQYDEAHCFELVGKCDPALIRACPWADRFFKAIGG